MDLFIGLDVGTTGVKGLLVDEKGRIMGNWSEPLELITPKSGWNEQDPKEWWKNVVAVLKRLNEKATEIGGKVRAISTSGQMHSLVLLDGKGNVLRNAILWNDQRTHRECEIITEEFGEEYLIKNVGNPVLTGFTLPKILWLKRNEPKIFENTRKILLPKDFINFMMTGKMVTEPSDASGTVAYGIDGEWKDEILEKLEIPLEIFPEVIPSNEVIGRLKREVANETGLSEDVLVVPGGADNACSALGVGVTLSGRVMISLGTSGTVLAPTLSEEPDPKGRVHFFFHVLKGIKYHMGVMLSATHSLNWFKERFLQESYGEINEMVSKSPAGSNGVIFLPYLNGERTPHRDPFARGVFFGISSFNSKEDVIRAIFEGVAFGIKDSFDILKNDLKVKIEDVRITGGGSKSDIWVKITADVLGHNLKRPQVNEGAAYGASMLAFSGFSKTPPERVADEWVIIKDEVDYSEGSHEIYGKLVEKYRMIYENLKEIFRI